MINKEKLKEINLWKTKLNPSISENEENVELVTINNYSTWVVTDFGKNLNGEFLYIVQPLVNEGGIGEGVTGLAVFVLTEEELSKNFSIK